ncbi:MAG: phosphatidylserine decarboxylase, partial [Alistipes sp.]|nr:phosphatidylserine decarboxylase [Alistipes sp.]
RKETGEFPTFFEFLFLMAIIIFDESHVDVIVLETGLGGAGLIARRIVSYIKVGDKVKQNDVFGFIKFGSRIDVLVPKNSELLVEIGDPVVGSQTPIVRLRK